MWCELSFKLSPEVETALFKESGRSPRGFRKLLAALDTRHSIGLPPRFFGYGEDGKADPKGDTVIGMGYTASGLRIVATGSTACDLLSDRAGAIHAALMTEAQAFIPLLRTEGEHGMEFLPFARKYVIPSLAVGKGTKDNFWYQASDAVKAGSSWLAEADRKIPTTISRGLMRHAMTLLMDNDDIDGPVEDLLGKSMRGERAWFETGQEFQKRLNIKLTAVTGHTFVQAGGISGRLCLKGVEFTMNAALMGPWFVGRLKIEAAGQLLQVFQSQPVRNAAVSNVSPSS
jgi:hypothetical protein